MCIWAGHFRPRFKSLLGTTIIVGNAQLLAPADLKSSLADCTVKLGRHTCLYVHREQKHCRARFDAKNTNEPFDVRLEINFFIQFTFLHQASWPSCRTRCEAQQQHFLDPTTSPNNRTTSFQHRKEKALNMNISIQTGVAAKYLAFYRPQAETTTLLWRPSQRETRKPSLRCPTEPIVHDRTMYSMPLVETGDALGSFFIVAVRVGTRNVE